MTQHPQIHLDVLAAPAGCSAQVLLLLPPALFPDPSLVKASAPGISAARSLPAPGIPNAAGWDHYELEKAVGWSKLHMEPSRQRRGVGKDSEEAFESRSQLTEAERAHIRLAEQSKRGKVRSVTQRLETGEEFRVLVSNEEDEELAEQRRQEKISVQANGEGLASAKGFQDAASLAQEYRALLLDLDGAQQERSITLQLHARYLAARPSKPVRPLLNAILSPASSGSYAEVRYPAPRVLWRCSSQGARRALDQGAMEANPTAVLPSHWTHFELPARTASNPGRLLFPPSSRHSSWHSLQLPQPTTAYMDDVVRYTHLASLLASVVLLVLTSRAAAKVSKAYAGLAGKLKKE